MWLHAILILMKKSIKPKLILISGRRYSGKDTLANILRDILKSRGYEAEIASTSVMLKTKFCQEKGLNLDKFLNDRSYKELYRDEFSSYVLQTPQRVNLDAFLNSLNHKNKDFIIISDIRSKYDLEKLRDMFKTLAIWVESNNRERSKRGWIKSKYDDSEFENQLDPKLFDYIIENNNSVLDLEINAITIISDYIK